jgi:hypothetical protein
MPNLPNTPATTAEMGLSIFDMSHDPDLKALANLLTKGDLPGTHRALYMNVINVALILRRNGMPRRAKVRLDRAATDLMARVSEKGKRVQQLLTPIEYEIHKEQKKRQEEHPQI